ncbi:MAG: esterase/lipase family protein [Phycisphaerae bacterium]
MEISFGLRAPQRRLVILPLTAFLLTSILGGCATSAKMPPIRELYAEAAQYHELERNPVIVIPGILGSRLVDEASGRVVWGAFSGGYANPQTTEGARLVALPMALRKPLRELRDDVQPTGVLDRLEVSLLGLPVQLEAYIHILKTLGVGGYRDEELGTSGAIDYGLDHFTCFQFAYDWRRDNVENAQRLHEYILEKKQYVEDRYFEKYGVRKDIRFDVVAHSMGGLILRYYLRYGNANLPDDGNAPQPTWAGAEYVERAILIGTPNAGSLYAWLNLLEGRKFSPLLPKFDAAVLGTHPSIYQLMPRSRHKPVMDSKLYDAIDLFDVEEWVTRGWGLVDKDNDEMLVRLLPDVTDQEARRAVARDHLTKCLKRAERFAAALDAPASPPTGTQLILFAGDAIQTAKRATYRWMDRKISSIETDCGDGTVLRSSALMDERVGQEFSPHLKTPINWSRVQFMFSDHVGLTRDTAFSDNVLYELLESPRRHKHD